MAKEVPSSISRSKEPKTDRRFFMKTVSAAIAGVFVGKKIGRHEQTVIKENYFEIENVRYFPMYEKHTDGPKIEFPDNTDTLFVEFNLRHFTTVDGELIELNQFTLPANKLKDVLSTSLYNGEVHHVTASKLMIEKAIRLQTPIALGDIGKVLANETETLLPIVTEDDKRSFYGGIALLIASALGEPAQRLLTGKIENKMNRRSFLKLTFGAVSSIAFLYGTWLVSGTNVFLELLSKDTTDPISRLLFRLRGLSTNIHPEDTLIFMRNVLFAIKMKELGESLKVKNENPLIAFNIGGAHNGVEDLLYLPIDVLRKIFVYINSEYIAGAIQKHGDNIGTTRVIKADDQGVFQDLYKIEDRELLDMINQNH